MKDLILHSAIAEMSPEDFTHPGLRTCTFIFCDDKPNENGQGIEYEDFAAIKSSSIGTPIKMKFIQGGHRHAEDDDDYLGAGGHMGSIPIGYIKDMYEQQAEDGTNQLVARAMLFADEYPDEIAYLDKAYAEGKAPGVSWELKYENSILKDGVEWLKGLITRAATFVRHPAYGNRTAILALASNKNIDEAQMMTQLSELVNENNDNNSETEGGNNRMDEKEIKELQDELAAAQATITEKNTEIENLTGKVEELTTANSEKETELAEFKMKELVASRTAALVEAGITLPTEPEKLAAKQAFIAKMDEESFAEYKTDLAEAIASSKKKEPKDALASLRQPERLPRFDAEAQTDDEKVTLVGLKSKFGSISRSNATVESE